MHQIENFGFKPKTPPQPYNSYDKLKQMFNSDNALPTTDYNDDELDDF